MAQDNWEPVLEKLVVSIRKKFSAAFDRKQIHNAAPTICAQVHSPQVLVVPEKFASADMRVLTNGPSIFLSNSMRKRGCNC